ncbi:hypothetical protein F751_5390 [Auxenochlorella protothecoides]|uniref:Protein kinase domain-containing protein n=1 Tax=Auxenochlorella protothecoides TaxID=3075 RepID=A0A087SP80_AUXPR|nr:hypothetical protein F751_5390 [Auxenochlorella protothecoides]KFM27534.1 hypothetical protein F751_5390 [Auxenochlorella protothecoides]
MDEVSQVKLLCSMALALANLHELGIVHCDIKPCNILVCVDANGEPTAKLVDFSGGEVTYAFCPNEGFKRPQMSGDVWAMACSMLELLQPGALGNGWEGKEYQRARGHKEHPARPLLHLIDGLPAGVLLRVIRALAFAPEQRCTAAELSEALEVHLQLPALLDPAQVDAGAGRCPHAALCRAVLDAARARLQACEGYAEAVAEACRLGWPERAAAAGC